MIFMIIAGVVSVMCGFVLAWNRRQMHRIALACALEKARFEAEEESETKLDEAFWKDVEERAHRIQDEFNRRMREGDDA